jgi:hypothetical protein
MAVRMVTIKGLWYTAAVLGILGAGVFLGREYEKRTSQASLPQGQVASQGELATLRAENIQLKTALTSSQQRVSASLAPREEKAATNSPPPDQLRVLANLQKRRMASMNMQYVDRLGKLTPAFAELFALTSAEQVALQQSIDRARERLGDLERQNATVKTDPNGAIVISVVPFPEAGGAVYDQFVKSFAETLGPERHPSFLALGVQQIETAFAQFGAGQRTLTISETPGPNGQNGYRLVDNQKQPQGHSTGTSQYRSAQELRAHLGPIERLLPPDALSQSETPKAGNR